MYTKQINQSIRQSISQLVRQSLYETLNQTILFIQGLLKSWIKRQISHCTYITEDNRGSWLMKVLV